MRVRLVLKIEPIFTILSSPHVARLISIIWHGGPSKLIAISFLRDVRIPAQTSASATAE
jgi:hypothetical protein